LLTLNAIYFLQHSLLILIVLLGLWFILFRPFRKYEFLMFVIASVSIVGQNYSVLEKGGFSFTHQDLFLMPYYEPFMWGFYYLFLKRLMGERDRAVGLSIRAVFGLVLTGVCFSVFSQDKIMLLVSTLVSSGVLLVLFHRRYDLYYAGAALVLGFVVEIFGVWTGQWSYPAPDFLGIPYWFATMWISMGILGRRFLIPLSEWLADKLPSWKRA
jgi:hypothetical protein